MLYAILGAIIMVFGALAIMATAAATIGLFIAICIGLLCFALPEPASYICFGLYVFFWLALFWKSRD